MQEFWRTAFFTETDLDEIEGIHGRHSYFQ